MKYLGLTALVSAALVMAGCGSDSSIDTSAMQPVKPNTLTICTSSPYEPFEFTKDGKDAGIDIDLSQAIAKEFKYQLEIKQTDFDAIFTAVDDGSCDMAASAVSITPERTEKNLFSNGYFEVNQSMLVRAEDKGTYTELNSLSGHKIAVQSGTTGAGYAMAGAPGAEVVEHADGDALFAALKDKSVDAVVQDFPVNSYHAQQDSGTVVTRTFTNVSREQYGFVMKKDATTLKDGVDKALSKIRDDGRYDDILAKYLGAAPQA